MRIDPTRFWEEVRLGEDSALELKEVRFRGRRVSAPRRNDIADELAGFANSGGGRLVLGVSDDRTPQSLDPSQLDVLMAMVSEICADSIEPPLHYDAHRVSVPSPGNGGVLVVDTPPEMPCITRPAGFSAAAATPCVRCNPMTSAVCCT